MALLLPLALSPVSKAAEEKRQRCPSRLGGACGISVALWHCLPPAKGPQQRGKAWSLLCCQAGTLGAGKGTGKGYICVCRYEIRTDLPFTPN